ncbi:hypothetical protein MW887_008798 [Aspergillus wentii]|nr:hypothetical protein MW887_008798 [Aspergillus wentii]
MKGPPDTGGTSLNLDGVGDQLGLQTSRTFERLNQIDAVRANGVGDHIPLPQLVVSGDQSAGKSSVLEGITGIPFPRQDGLCTRFATEIILRHQPGEKRARVTIIPHVSRAEEVSRRLGAFQRNIGDFAELPDIINEAAQVMGLRGSDGSHDAPAFSGDVLRLEVSGHTGLHLTIVDLPGLISVSENEEDVRIVRDLVDSYLKNSRTIIMAVVPASSDIDTQGIIQRARHFDKDGLRTVGIITKPDLINTGTEGRVVRLAKNLDNTKLKLGFFLLKNPTPVELDSGISLQARRKAEMNFFSTGAWYHQGLDLSRVGIDNLRSFLQDLLESHIERELPKVRQDVRRLLNELNEELAELGTERSTPSQIRVYLSRISSEFYNLVKAGVDGAYEGRDAGFFRMGTDDLSCRLRAAVHIENERFARYMRTDGEKRKVVEDGDLAEAETADGQLLVSEAEMTAWVRQIYHQTRGRELPGNDNHALQAELFHAQSERWADIGRRHLEAVVDLISRFIRSALEFVIKDGSARHNISQTVLDSLHNNIRAAHEELTQLLRDEAQHPITYNHYYTDNIQKARKSQSKEQLKELINNARQQDWGGQCHFTNSIGEMERLISSLQKHITVAMKTFVDNVCRQVIERHVLAKLPDVFNPVMVSTYDDDYLVRLAAESSQVCHRRAEAHQLQQALERSLRDLGN